jgi:acyl carrier protein
MNSEIINKILPYIITEFVELSNRTSHESYCLFPWEPCTCQDKNAINLTTPLISSGYIDSFSMVTIVTFLEKEFSISIPDSEIIPKNFDSVQAIVDLVEKFKK